MKEIKKYMDIIRYGKSQTQDVLHEGDYITISEKLDGANAQFSLDENSGIGVYCQSRKQVLSKDNTLRGFYDWVQDIIVPNKHLLNPKYRYFGEYLVPHKIQYKEEFYNQFYLFNIYDEEKEEYLNDDQVELESTKLGIKTVPYFYKGEFISFNHLMSFVGKSIMTVEENTGEGIVVKNVNYKDKYGKQCFVKLVSEKFAEVQKQKLPKNPNINSKEVELIKSILTKPRVDKLMHKLVDENLLSKKDFCIESMGKLLKLLGGRVKEDMIKEESELLNNIEDKVLCKQIGKILPLVLKEVIKEY